MNTTIEKMDTLVDTQWLSKHLDDPDLLVLDCSVTTELVGGSYRNISGRADYEKGHIPSAGFADLTTELCDNDSPIEFAMPSPDRFCSVMGELGVSDNSRVVLYDAFLSAWAARVWWMLRWAGFDQAAILNGGLQKWKTEGRPLSTQPAKQTTKHFNLNLRPELIADQKEVLATINHDAVNLIDTMPEEFYRGEQCMYARPGHIPGATNTSALKLIDKSGCYLPQEKLATLINGNHNTRTITYCGGGIAASSNAFIMTRLGFTNVAVYTASLQEWAANPSNPMAVGSK